MAELLQDCGYGKQYRSAKWLAIQANPDVYLEAVETAKDTQEEITRTGAAGLGLPEWAACEGAYSRKAYWRMANT